LLSFQLFPETEFKGTELHLIITFKMNIIVGWKDEDQLKNTTPTQYYSCLFMIYGAYNQASNIQNKKGNIFT